MIAGIRPTVTSNPFPIPHASPIAAASSAITTIGTPLWCASVFDEM